MDVKEMKMRVIYSSDKPKMANYATALGEAFNCLVDECPPGFRCDKERLVIMGLSLNNEPNDKLRLFCRELTEKRAHNVLLFIEGEKDSKALKMVKEILKEAGTNVIDNDFYVTCGGFFASKKISLDERRAIVNWAQGVIASL